MLSARFANDRLHGADNIFFLSIEDLLIHSTYFIKEVALFFNCKLKWCNNAALPSKGSKNKFFKNSVTVGS